MTVLKERATIIDALGTSLSYGGQALDAVPELLCRVLEDEAWREFVTKLGEHVEHVRFTEFVAAKPLAGLGASVEMLQRIVADNAKASRLLRKTLKGTNNISTKSRTTRHGTRRDYALERLKKDRPDLHAMVEAKKVSAHAAMIAAGFRPRTATVPIDDPERLAATLRRRLDPTTLEQLLKLLSSDRSKGGR